jgi:putative ABC transport system ATP-binding protein
MTPAPILTFEHLHLENPSKVLIQDFNGVVLPQEIVIITGPSGSGKSSFLRLMNRLDSFTSGQIRFHQEPLETYEPALLRQRIGYVFQTPVFFEGTVLENLEQLKILHPQKAFSPDAYKKALQSVGLPQEILQQEAKSLSLGEKQRLSIARALLLEPEVLLLDEPTSALDAEAAAHILETLQHLNQTQNLTLLIVTHQVQEGRKIGHRFWHLAAGELNDITANPSAIGVSTDAN